MDFDSIIVSPAKLSYGLFFLSINYFGKFFFFFNFMQKKVNIGHSSFLGLHFLKEPHAKAQRKSREK